MSIALDTMKVRITLTQEMLGTKSADPDQFAEYGIPPDVSPKVAKEEFENAQRTQELVDEPEDKVGRTVFHRNKDGEVILYNYQIKGFLKEAGDVLRQAVSSSSTEESPTGKGKKWGSIKSKMDNHVFVFPRYIPVGLKELQWTPVRPIKCMTQQGPRISLIQSEQVPEGTSFECEIRVLKDGPVSLAMIRETLDYGLLKGLGQWRNSGMGSFEWKEVTG